MGALNGGSDGKDPTMNNNTLHSSRDWEALHNGTTKKQKKTPIRKASVNRVRVQEYKEKNLTTERAPRKQNAVSKKHQQSKPE